ncbi:MAG: ABC transporter substrate-binding protein [Bacteroidetes bacterium]|nr:ABC transporter substrate-binding protein [Bacteroidota bacterium]
MPTFTDQTLRSIYLPSTPQRIVSCVPSQTELLFDLGLGDRLVGTTKFCIHPPESLNKVMIGGTKNLNIDKIFTLNPDLIIGNKEENDKNQIELLEKNFPVWISDVKTLADAYAMITSIGAITNTSNVAQLIAKRIVALYSNFSVQGSPLRVAYLIWHNPIMTVGHDTFINEIIKIAGFVNCFEHKTRYPTLSVEELSQAKPDLIFLSSEPFPFSQKHVDIFQKQFPATCVKLVNGEFFSWYGTRLIGAYDYLQNLSTHIYKR